MCVNLGGWVCFGGGGVCLCACKCVNLGVWLCVCICEFGGLGLTGGSLKWKTAGRPVAVSGSSVTERTPTYPQKALMHYSHAH